MSRRRKSPTDVTIGPILAIVLFIGSVLIELRYFLLVLVIEFVVLAILGNIFNDK